MTTGSESVTGAAMVGRILAGRYRILDHLGEGAMGSVYLAEHLRIGRRDAIKVLRTDIAQDREAVARFARGARNVSAIRHPNVCTIYDFSDAEDGLQYLAMEYVAGETLKDTLDREGRLEPQRALRIARQVALALQAAHDAGIVHRDLKPGNIMITPLPDGTDGVKVVDFDIAKGPDQPEGEEVTRLGFVVGTPEYMSPEQLMGDRLDGRSDVYSLGVVLFRMLTGALPFRAASTQEIMVQRLTAAPLRLSDVLPTVQFPDLLEDVLARAQTLDRTARYADAASLARDLEGMLHGASPSPAFVPPAPSAGARETPPTVLVPSAAAGTTTGQWAAGVNRPATPRRGLLIAAAVAVVAVIGVGATLLLPRGDGDGAEAHAPAAATSAETGDVVQRTTQPVGPEQVQGGAPPVTPAENGSGRSGGSRVPVEPSVDLRQPEPAPPAPRTEPGPFDRVDQLLERQRVALAGVPGAAVLTAIRDSATTAWHLARTSADSTTAAAVLANAALQAGDMPECRRWAQTAARLGSSAAAVLLEACR